MTGSCLLTLDAIVVGIVVLSTTLLALLFFMYLRDNDMKCQKSAEWQHQKDMQATQLQHDKDQQEDAQQHKASESQKERDHMQRLFEIECSTKLAQEQQVHCFFKALLGGFHRSARNLRRVRKLAKVARKPMNPLARNMPTSRATTAPPSGSDTMQSEGEVMSDPNSVMASHPRTAGSVHHRSASEVTSEKGSSPNVQGMTAEDSALTVEACDENCSDLQWAHLGTVVPLRGVNEAGLDVCELTCDVVVLEISRNPKEVQMEIGEHSQLKRVVQAMNIARCPVYLDGGATVLLQVGQLRRPRKFYRAVEHMGSEKRLQKRHIVVSPQLQSVVEEVIRVKRLKKLNVRIKHGSVHPVCLKRYMEQNTFIDDSAASMLSGASAVTHSTSDAKLDGIDRNPRRASRHGLQ